jgi:hypothetical protein
MSDAVGPVFVAGCPRSGTTALSWAIAAHPRYHTSAETHFFYYLLREAEDNSLRRVFDQSSGGGSWLKKWDVGFEEFLFHMGRGFDRMIREKTGGLQWVDGSPENAMVARPLLTMYPTAHMFVLMRDPRSVCLSMLNSGFAPPWARDLDAAIAEWRYYARIAAELAAVCPDRVLIVKQEALRPRSAVVAAAVGERLGLAAPDPIARFLTTTTINSSFDKRTYAPNSPFRAEGEIAFPAEQFMARHGAYIMHETADLAERFGYLPEEPVT